MYIDVDICVHLVRSVLCVAATFIPCEVLTVENLMKTPV